MQRRVMGAPWAPRVYGGGERTMARLSLRRQVQTDHLVSLLSPGALKAPRRAASGGQEAQFRGQPL